MPFDPVRVARVMADGLAAVCASCTLYWRARDAGLPGHQCLARERCGSPLVGDVFHEYDGPLLGALHNFCFACGSKATHLARVRDKPRGIGVCASHLRLFETLQANGRALTPVPLPVVLAPGGKPVSVGPKLARKSLFAAIQEVEDHYAKSDEEPA